MAKFKVGDIVVANKKSDERYCFTNRKAGKMRVVGVNDTTMEVEILKENDHRIKYGVLQDCFEKVQEKIIIYRDGDKVFALDVDSKRKAVAKCSPDDEFDFKTGAKLAFSRLFENEDRRDCIHVDDLVEVVKKGKTYSAYGDWKYLTGYEGNFVYGSAPENGLICKVLRIEKHGLGNIDIALIQNPKTTQVFIIGIEGIRKVEK